MRDKENSFFISLGSYMDQSNMEFMKGDDKFVSILSSYDYEKIYIPKET